MAEESDLEKTEEASPRRLEKAREEGDVPRSRELASCSVLLAAGLGLMMLGSQLAAALKTALAGGLSLSREAIFDPVILATGMAQSLADLLIAFLPLAGLLFLVAIASPALIGGWNISAKALVPNFARMNPMKGIGNMFSKNALMEFIKAVVKAVLVGSVAYLVITSDLDDMLALSLLPTDIAISQVGALMLKAFLSIVSALVLIAAIDVPYQLKHYADKLKMTKEEVRQESKESEGNPQIKARIRQQQREMARRRMMAEIPKADVVITNPTHYAVAIKYKDSGMRAPTVVAKGADAIALKIREIAGEHSVPTLEAPKLARALYAHTELGDEIPETLYAAVAEVLAYVFQMRSYKTHGGYQPEMPTTLEIPAGLDPLEAAGDMTGAAA
jgi:flagellar biosynthetic protein FlhB